MSIEVGLVEVMKTIIEVGLGLTLLRKWRKTRQPMYTDLPFLMGIALTFVGIGEAFDALGDLGFFEYTIFLFKIRWLFIALMMGVSLLVLTQIWIPNRPRVKIGMPLVFIASWLIIMVFVPDRYALYQVLIVYMLVFMIPYIITFFLLNHYHRLPEINSSVMLVGIFFLLVGQVSKSSFMALGFLWISEIIDLIGYSFMYLSFVYPPKWAHKPVESPGT